MRNVPLPTLAPLLRTLPLQEMPRHLHVWLAAGLYNKVSVLIGLGDNTHCNLPHDCAKASRDETSRRSPYRDRLPRPWLPSSQREREGQRATYYAPVSPASV